MKLYITGDVHLNEWDEFSTILPNGINSRLQVGLDAIDQVASAAVNNVLVIAGDLFHTREEISVQVLYRAGEAIKAAASVCKEVVILVGNHDQHLKDGRVHSLATFGFSNVRVIDKPEIYNIGGFGEVLFMPYMHDYIEFSRVYAELAPKVDMSILHADIVGFEMNSGFLATRGVSPESLLEHGIKLSISGHYHKPQKFGELDVYYTGSPYQMDRSEAGHEKRYLIVSNEDSGYGVDSVKFVDLPVFRKITLKEAAAKKSNKKDFIDVSCDEDEAREGWSGDFPPNFNVVLKRSARSESDFTSVEMSSACQMWLKEKDRPDLIEAAMERLARNA